MASTSEINSGRMILIALLAIFAIQLATEVIVLIKSNQVSDLPFWIMASLEITLLTFLYGGHRFARAIVIVMFGAMASLQLPSLSMLLSPHAFFYLHYLEYITSWLYLAYNAGFSLVLLFSPRVDAFLRYQQSRRTQAR